MTQILTYKTTITTFSLVPVKYEINFDFCRAINGPTKINFADAIDISMHE